MAKKVPSGHKIGFSALTFPNENFLHDFYISFDSASYGLSNDTKSIYHRLHPEKLASKNQVGIKSVGSEVFLLFPHRFAPHHPRICLGGLGRRKGGIGGCVVAVWSWWDGQEIVKCVWGKRTQHTQPMRM